MPHWLWSGWSGAPLFVSHARLRRYSQSRALPRARLSWALDSGGFTQLSQYGRWTFTAAEYARAVARYDRELGGLSWAAPMDWMCEPYVLAKTGLTVAEHQTRTVENYLDLRELWRSYSDESCPFMPVLQGYQLEDYLRCVDLYADAGVDLMDPANPGMADEPVVGVGSVCRRQSTTEVAGIFAELASTGLWLHGFGVKSQGLGRYSQHLISADSMAWSARGRRVAGCHPSHANEANCPRFALEWYHRALAAGAPRKRGSSA